MKRFIKKSIGGNALEKLIPGPYNDGIDYFEKL